MDYCYYVDEFSGIARLVSATAVAGDGDWWVCRTHADGREFVAHGDELHAWPW